MKIDKLITLSQFVKQINAKIKAEGEGRFDNTNLESILAYEEFLDQPLKTEMFINEASKPLACYVSCNERMSRAYDRALEWWQDGEGKVIFKGWLFDDTINTIVNEPLGYTFDLDDNAIFAGRWVKDPTIHDLAEATKGEVSANIEL